MKTNNYKARSLYSWFLYSLMTVLGLWITGANAGVNGYSLVSGTGTFTPNGVGATTILDNGGLTMNHDSRYSGAINIGFTFNFDGVNYTQFRTTTNGILVLGNPSLNASATTNSFTSTTSNITSTTPVIAPLWDDLDGNVTTPNVASHNFLLTGTPGSRVLTIEWLYWQWNWSATGNTISFQVKLYEGSNYIDYIYRQESGAVNSGSATIGLGYLATSDYLTLNNTSASPTASTTNTTNLNTKPATGQVYRFLPPSCIAPSGLTSSLVTATSATIGWTAASPAPASGYEYYLSTSSTAPTAGTTPTGATAGTSAGLAGLAPATQYYFWVRSFCSVSDKSAWAGSATFTTPCLPISSFPWTEGFESLATTGTNSYPPCWLEQNGDWTSGTASSQTYNDPRSGTKYIYNVYSATNEFMWTPGFDLTAGTAYDFSFYFAGDDRSGWTGDVFQNTLQSGTGATQLGGSFIITGTTSTSAYTKVTRTFIPSGSGTYYFGIRINANSTPWYIGFDDFSLDLTPACPAPNSLSASAITETTATVNWVCTGCTGSYVIEYGPQGFAPGTGTTTTAGAGSTSVGIAGLTGGTTYDFYVSQDCGGGNVSPNSGVASFRTAGPCALYEDPFATATASTFNNTITISTITYAGEYNTINSIVAGNTYTFASSNVNDWLTLTNAADSSVLAFGNTPLVWTATFSGSVHLHVSTNSSCGTQASGRTTSVTCSSCPQAPCFWTSSSSTATASAEQIPVTISTTQDAGQYSTISSIVSGNTYEFTSSVATDWLVLTTTSNVVLAEGNTPLVYTAATSGSVRLHVSTNSTCGTEAVDRTTGVLCTSCPAVNYVPASGSNSYTLCSGNLYDNGGSTTSYQNNSNGYTVLYPATAGDLLSISGTLTSETNYDSLFIYDGVGTGGTLLFKGAGSSGVTVPTVYAGSIGGALTVRFKSDVSVTYAGFNLAIACVPDYLATVVSTSTGAANWCPGETRSVSVTVKNNGTKTWNTTSTVEVGVKWNSDAVYQTVSAGSVAFGNQVTYTFNVTAPATGGAEALTFAVLNDGSSIGSASAAQNIYAPFTADAGFDQPAYCGLSTTLSAGDGSPAGVSGSATPNLAITSNATFNSTISLTTPLNANQLNSVFININHTFDGDLDISLIAPDGSIIDLSSDNGSSGDNYVNTVFSTSGPSITTGSAPFTGIYTPEQPFSSLTGSANGTWTLRVTDDAAGDVGTLISWGLVVGPLPYTYSWSGPSGFTSSDKDITVSEDGTYSVTMTSVFGCTSSDNVSVARETEAPVCSPATLDLTLSGGYAEVSDASLLDYGPSDNCGVASIAFSNPNDAFFTCADANMPRSIEYIVTDISNNYSVCYATVTALGDVPSVTISQSNAAGFCQGNDVTLTAVPTPSADSYSWSTGAATQSIAVAASGTYTVSVVNSYGCTAENTLNLTYDASALSSSYTIIAFENAHLRKFNTVLNGGVGVVEAKGKAKVEDKSVITAATTFVKANTLDIHNGALVTNRIQAPAYLSLPAFVSNPYSGTTDAKVNDNAIATLSGSVYKKIEIGKNAVVTFTEPVIYADEVKVKDGAQLVFSGCTKVVVNKKVELDKNTTTNAAGAGVTFYIEEGGEAFKVGEGSEFTGNVYAETGEIHIEKAKANNQTTLTGQFIAKKVNSEEHVNWNWNTNCDPSCAPAEAACECTDGIKSLSFGYSEWDVNSPEIATLEFYEDEFAAVPFATINAVPGVNYTVTAPGAAFGSYVYVKVVQNGITTAIPTTCGSDIVGSFFRELYILSQTDGQNNLCEITACGTGRTPLCHTPKNKPSHTHCVKEKDVAKKLAKADWSNGPCGTRSEEAATGTLEVVSAQPALAAYPNPFTTATNVTFVLPTEDNVKLEIYNMTGQLIATLFDGKAEAGQQYSYEFKAEDHAAGMYFYRLETSNGKFTGKLTLTK